jgi:ATP-dependent RNA/DNA helicase IGHMBP2
MPHKHLEEIERLIETLQVEKEEDFIQFRKFVQSLPLSKKKEKGLCWYPFRINKSGYTYGERAFVVGERTANTNESHRFRSGMPVNVFYNREDKPPLEEAGVIKFIDRNKMKIVLRSKDVPDWIDKSNIGIDLLFDERTYLEMEKILKKVLKARGDRLAEIRDIFLGKGQPRFRNLVHHIEVPHLNPSQNAAVNNILAAHDISILHGPPGTGKTTTIVQAVKLLSKQENLILVTAPSNAAVDLLTEKLSDEGLNVVRIGNISRVDESLIKHTLDGRLAEHPEAKNIKKIRIQAADARRKARKFKRTFDFSARQERKELYKEAGELSDWARQVEERILDQIISSANVVTCTLINSIHSLLDGYKFETVIIDEAAQALEPATWIPISRASKVVLAGDPFQLPPTVKSQAAAKRGLGVTLIEKGIQKFPQVNLLNIQYRMNHLIMGFSNDQFYDGKLLADVSVEHWDLGIEGENPLEFIDTAGSGFEEKVNSESGSKCNPDEFQILQEHLYQLMTHFDEENLPSIGIISPYREQVKTMEEISREDPKLESLQNVITINTIDAFQGQERDIIYISLVRSNEKQQIGFLSDARRMNVAMTRAKKKLIIIGDSATIGSHSFYSDFIEYVEAYGAYRTAWEFMY